MIQALLIGLIVMAGGAPENRLQVLSEKLAMDLRDSRHCEINPDNGYTQCQFTYRGLQFVRRTVTLPSGRHSFVDIERLDPGDVGVSLTGYGPCFAVQVTADRPEDAAAAYMNVRDGRIAADGRTIGCFPQARTPKP